MDVPNDPSPLSAMVDGRGHPVIEARIVLKSKQREPHRDSRCFARKMKRHKKLKAKS
jgi:hypothetical protein